MSRIEIAAAIDLLEGRAVRLLRGDYATPVADGGDPLALAHTFARAGIPRLHLVDLEGARAGMPRQLALAAAVADAARSEAPAIRIELGGGLRDDEAVAAALAIVDDAIVGSAAIRDPALVERLAARHPGRIAVALDLRDGRPALDGWTVTATGDPIALAAGLLAAGVRRLLVTDTARDGALAGANLVLLRRFRAALPEAWLGAAGGIASLDDIRDLAAAGVDGAVVGRAFLEGGLSLADALGAAVPA